MWERDTPSAATADQAGCRSRCPALPQGPGDESGVGQGGRPREGLGPRSMRVSINMDEDAASEAASLANLSLKVSFTNRSTLQRTVHIKIA